MWLSRTSYDAIVVGGGVAGCVCAARLAASGRATLLVEGGPKDPSPASRFGLVPPDQQSSWFWPPIVETSDDGPSSRSRYWSGSGLGGGSAVNGMLLATGSTADFERWVERHRCQGWSAAEMAPWYEMVLGHLAPEKAAAPPLNSNAGRVHAAFVDAAAEGGWLPSEATTIDPDARGLLVPVLATKDGNRRTMADAYLHQRDIGGGTTAGARNLSVLCEAPVECVELNGNKVAGVVLADRTRIRAPLVVAAAGVVGSPRLLSRSDLSGSSGSGVKNHPGLAVTFPWSQAETADDPAPFTARHPQVLSVLRFDLEVAPGTTDDSGCGRLAEIQLIGPFQQRARPTGLLVLVLLDPTSSGRLLDAGATKPHLVTNRLERVADRLAFRAGYGIVAALAGGVTDRLHLSAPSVGGEALIQIDRSVARGVSDSDRWLRARQGTVFHAVGTCCMGPAATAGRWRTDSDPKSPGAVWGVDGLFVADTSIFPDLVSGGLHLTAAAVAERIAAGLT